MTSRITQALALAALTFPACDPSAPRTDVLLEGLPLRTAEEQRRIGDVESPELGFTRVHTLDVDRDGMIYVLEAAVPEIRVLSPEGALLRRIGREGDGPGEFSGPPRWGVVGDTVWTWDFGHNRITLFDRQGTVLSTGRTNGIRIALPSSYGYVQPNRMRPDGRFTASFTRIQFLPADEVTGVSPTDRIPWPLVLFDASGAVTDTIGWAGRPPPRMWSPPSESRGNPFRSVEAGGRRVTVPTPPVTVPWWVDLLDGYVIVDAPAAVSPGQGSFTVTRFGLDEDTIYHRTYSYIPQPYEEAELDAIAMQAARGAGGPVAIGGSAPPPPPNVDAIAAELRSLMDYPEFRPPIEAPRLFNDERLWLRRATGDSSVQRWIVLDTDGHPEAEVELPGDLRVLWAAGDTVWGVVLDEFDVQWVVEYRID